MRISDWSSDVCSSDLELVRPVRVAADQDRLQDALRLDRFRERIDRRLVEVVTRLESAWAQVLDGHGLARADLVERSEEPPSELQSLMRISYAVFCLQNNIIIYTYRITNPTLPHDRHQPPTTRTQLN